jgi:hypothetical protein
MTSRRLSRIALVLALVAGAPGARAVPGPWARTETRQPCASFEVFRQPYFGDTHVHTSYSSDAVFAGTRENPRGAYRFAQGQVIGLPPYDANDVAQRTAQLRRPLDFTAVTDHAEQFGEIQICLTPGYPGYDSPDCVSARNQLAMVPPPVPSLLPPIPVITFLLPYGVTTPPERFDWCGIDNADCLAEASLIWQDTQGRPRSSTTARPPAPSRPSSRTSGAASRAATTCTATSSSGTTSSRRCPRATWSSRRRRASGRRSRASVSTVCPAATSSPSRTIPT